MKGSTRKYVDRKCLLYSTKFVIYIYIYIYRWYQIFWNNLLKQPVYYIYVTFCCIVAHTTWHPVLWKYKRHHVSWEAEREVETEAEK